jgi:hypothetical protein
MSSLERWEPSARFGDIAHKRRYLTREIACHGPSPLLVPRTDLHQWRSLPSFILPDSRFWHAPPKPTRLHRVYRLRPIWGGIVHSGVQTVAFPVAELRAPPKTIPAFFVSKLGLSRRSCCRRICQFLEFADVKALALVRR